MEANERQKWLIRVVVVAAALYFGNSLVFEPLKQNWLDRDKKIRDTRDEYNRDSALVQNEARIKARWAKEKNHALDADNRSAAETTLLKALAGWQQNNRGLNIEQVTPHWGTDEAASTGTNNDVVTTLECRLDGSGSMQSLMSFLWSIENDSMGVKIQDLELATKDNFGQELSIGINISALALPGNSSSNTAPTVPASPNP